MTDRVSVGNLRVARVLYDFVNNEALPGTDIDPDSFWAGVDKVVADLTPQNQGLLNRRDELQAQIDKWHRHRVIEPVDPEAYRQFLTEIGYLLPEPDDFTITTSGVDPEITTTAGPQLVVPVTNARFALNAANARWGSLYDAFYGTDALPSTHDLAPGYDGKLSWPGVTNRTDLWCTAKNTFGPVRQVCFTPVVAVRETGAVYTSHDEVCTEDELEPAQAVMLPVKLDMRREPASHGNLPRLRPLRRSIGQARAQASRRAASRASRGPVHW